MTLLHKEGSIRYFGSTCIFLQPEHHFLRGNDFFSYNSLENQNHLKAYRLPAHPLNQTPRRFKLQEGRTQCWKTCENWCLMLRQGLHLTPPQRCPPPSRLRYVVCFASFEFGRILEGRLVFLCFRFSPGLSRIIQGRHYIVSTLVPRRRHQSVNSRNKVVVS